MEIETYQTFGVIDGDQIIAGDQIIVDGELTVILTVDSDREDVDEVFVTVENLSDPFNTEFSLFADDHFTVWGI